MFFALAAAMTTPQDFHLSIEHPSRLGMRIRRISYEMEFTSEQLRAECNALLAAHDLMLRETERVDRALAQGNLSLWLQPILPCFEAEHLPPLFEVYFRLSEDGRVIAPCEFIGALSRNLEMMRSLDRYIILRVVQCANPHVRYAINLSGASLQSIEFAHWLRNLLQQAPHIKPGQLLFEVTEHTAAEPEVAECVLLEISRMGCKVGLDDYGTGYDSSLYLRRFGGLVSFLKLDGDLIRNLDQDCPRAIVQGHLHTAQSLGLEVMAECVETHTVEALLKDVVLPFGDTKLWIQGYGVGAIERWIG